MDSGWFFFETEFPHHPFLADHFIHKETSSKYKWTNHHPNFDEQLPEGGIIPGVPNIGAPTAGIAAATCPNGPVGAKAAELPVE